jgi:hypothetical protein
MPPILFLTLPPAAPVDTETQTPGLRLGDLVRRNGRLYFVRGFDPMGVAVPLAYLEDAETCEPRTVLLEEIVDEPYRRASAA